MTASSPFTKPGIKPGEQKTMLSTNASPLTLERNNPSISTGHFRLRALVGFSRDRAADKYDETLKNREQRAGRHRRLRYSHRTGEVACCSVRSRCPLNEICLTRIAAKVLPFRLSEIIILAGSRIEKVFLNYRINHLHSVRLFEMSD